MIQYAYTPAVHGLICVHQGKVRDTFAIPNHPDLLLTVATDRVSTHNVVHESLIPKKGYALTALTVFWMNEQLPEIETHLVASGEAIFKYLPDTIDRTDLVHRGLIIRKLTMIPVEFIFRNRMAGSLWKDCYQKGLPNPYGIELSPGLQLMSPFSDTVFTPTDKSATDEPLHSAATILQHKDAYLLAREAYETGKKYAALRDIEIIDGKFEVGLDSNGQVILADECLTPDSCRFVPSGSITVGQEPTWLDKQYLREEAERAWGGGNKLPLTFSAHVVRETTRRYEAIVEALTGVPLQEFQEEHHR